MAGVPPASAHIAQPTHPHPHPSYPTPEAAAAAKAAAELVLAPLVVPLRGYRKVWWRRTILVPQATGHLVRDAAAARKLVILLRRMCPGLSADPATAHRPQRLLSLPRLLPAAALQAMVKSMTAAGQVPHFHYCDEVQASSAAAMCVCVCVWFYC